MTTGVITTLYGYVLSSLLCVLYQLGLWEVRMGFGWAKVGLKCICISSPNSLLVVGSEYTITGTLMNKGVEYIEVLEAVADWAGDKHYQISRFRPLVSLEDDISMFTALTNMSPVERLDRLKEMLDQ